MNYCELGICFLHSLAAPWHREESALHHASGSVNASRQFEKTAQIPLERSSKIIGIHVNNSSFDELELEISWIIGGSGKQTRGPPS